MPATGQHATPIVRRVTFSAISCASCGFVTHVLYLEEEEDGVLGIMEEDTTFNSWPIEKNAESVIIVCWHAKERLSGLTIQKDTLRKGRGIEKYRR